MKSIYKDKDYIKQTFEILKEQVHDLGMVSAYNDDIFNEETTEIERIMEKIGEKIKKLI